MWARPPVFSPRSKVASPHVLSPRSKVASPHVLSLVWRKKQKSLSQQCHRLIDRGSDHGQTTNDLLLDLRHWNSEDQVHQPHLRKQCYTRAMSKTCEGQNPSSSGCNGGFFVFLCNLLDHKCLSRENDVSAGRRIPDKIVTSNDFILLKFILSITSHDWAFS